MKKPNFFIVGAPKCGTTSMAAWLATHPQIFMSKLKEPHFYNTDHKHNVVIDYDHYLSLFKDANDTHKIVGEASVWYLYSNKAIKNITNDLKGEDLKFLVMLRNPVEMAYSLHEQQVFNLNEPIKEFKAAWALQAERKNGKKIGLTTREPKHLLYGEACKLGIQLQKLYRSVDANKIKVVLLEDLKKNAEEEYKKVLSFLQIDFDDRTNFKPLNESKLRKFPAIVNVIKILSLTKQKLGIRKGLGILNKANSINSRPAVREKLEPEFENELKEYFKEDINLLSAIIKRDLSHWAK
jgi:hypothetical protein